MTHQTRSNVLHELLKPTCLLLHLSEAICGGPALGEGSAFGLDVVYGTG